nr:glutamic acid-rich protein-like [Tanacetum cinerariifolium]
VDCLPNEEIFAGLARMGYEKPSTKLTFYKAFFSTQWKFFIHTILYSLSSKRTSWNEFSSAMASALICLSSGQRFNFSKYIFESLVCNVDSSSKFYMYPRVGKGFSRVETPLFETMLAVKDVAEEAEAQILTQGDDVQKHAEEEVATDVVQPTPTSPLPSSPVIPSSHPHQSSCPPQPQAAEGSSHVFQQVLDTCSALVLRVEGLENANAAQQLEIVKLKARVKKLEKLNKVKSSKLKRLRKVLSMQEDDIEVQAAVEVVTTAKIITEVVTAAATQVAAASTPIPAAKPKILKIA